MIPVWIVGNGGHAKVAIDTIRAGQRFRLAGIISDDPATPPVEPDVPHIGPLSSDVVREYGIQHTFIAIGANSVRARIAHLLDGNVTWVSIVHPSAIVSPTATIGSGVLLCAGSIVQPFVTIGDHTIINTAATVDHDSNIGAFSHIAPGVHLSGAVTVGEGAFLGIGSAAIPGAQVGAWSVVGAGSTVVHDLPPNITAVGTPARIIKEREPGWHR
jgi:sugar O-acyltransferase (sialic acid O-acetyltransferase NeuD family)